MTEEDKMSSFGLLATRAIEVASEAKGATKDFRAALHKHEEYDNQRFSEVIDKMSKGFNGIYNRLWIAAGGIIAILAAIAFKDV